MIVIIVTGTRYPSRETKAKVCNALSDFRDRKDVVVIQVFVGNRQQSLSHYKQSGGAKAGLHLMSALASEMPRPVVGEVVA